MQVVINFIYNASQYTYLPSNIDKDVHVIIKSVSLWIRVHWTTFTSLNPIKSSHLTVLNGLFGRIWNQLIMQNITVISQLISEKACYFLPSSQLPHSNPDILPDPDLRGRVRPLRHLWQSRAVLPDGLDQL